MPKNVKSSSHRDLPIVDVDNNSESGNRRFKRGPIRAAVLLLVHVVILAHITHYLMSGRSLSPVEPSETMHALERGHLNAGTIFFGLAILSTAVFGRFFCGWACHIVALQDLCSYLLRRIGIRPKPLRSRLLIIVPFVVAFYMFFLPTIVRLWYGSPHPGITNHLMTESFWQTFPGPVVSVLTFAVCGGLIVYLLGNKGFCTYGCPYGAFFSIADRLAVGRIRVTDACQHCGQCTAACTSNVFVHAEVRDYGMVVDPGCLKCTDCISACPNDALFFGFADKRSPENRTALSEIKPRKRTYDFTLAEEAFGLAVAAAVVFALRGLYDITPFLLSVGLGVITAYLAIQVWRIFRVRDLRIQNWQLKRNQQITRVGFWAVAGLLVWFVFNAHSFVVQYSRYGGRLRLAQVELAWDEVLYTQPLDRLTNEDLEDVDGAIKSFELTDRIGLQSVWEVKLGLAKAHLAKGEMGATETYLRQAYDCNPGGTRNLLIEFLGTQGRQEEAREFF